MREAKKIQENKNANAFEAPIYIGITGHRDIPDEDRLSHIDTIKKIMANVVSLAPNSNVKLLTPLAKGADRLAAYAAKELNIPYIVVMPFSKKIYEKDFDSREDLSEFRKLLSEAEASLELEPYGNHKTGDINKYGPKRDIEYAKAGAFVSDNSHVLIALWNGCLPAESKFINVGGTEQVICYRIEGLMKGFRQKEKELTTPDCGNVYHIFARRGQKQKEIQSIPDDINERFRIEEKGAYRILSPKERKEDGELDWGQKYAENMIKRYDRFNKDQKKYRSKESENKSAEYLYGKKTDLDEPEKNIQKSFAVLDSLATRLQNKNKRLFKLILILCAGSFVSIPVFNDFVSYPAFFVLAPVLFGFAAAVYFYTQKIKLEDRYYEYRTMAEGLRVKFFWQMYGIKDNIDDCYPAKYWEHMNWFLFFFRNLDLKNKIIQTKAFKKTRPGDTLNKRIKEKWICDQKGYFQDKLEKNGQYMKLKHFVSIGIGISLAIVVLIIFAASLDNAKALFHSAGIYADSKFHKILTLVIDILIAAGGSHIAYHEWEAVDFENELYRRMRRLYDRALARFENFEKDSNHENMKKIIHELGHEALNENADWLHIQVSNSMELKL